MNAQRFSTVCFSWRTRLVLVFVVLLPVANGPLGETKAQDILCSDEGAIAFISDRDGTQQIYLMNTDGSSLVRLTDFEEADLSDLDWSPDGKYLAFVNDSDIYTLDVEELTVTRLTIDHHSKDYHPAWSPDGASIAFTSTRGGPYDLWIMDTDGSILRRMTNDPRWEITVEWIPDGTGIAYVPNSGANLEIWTAPWDESFDWNTPFLFEDPIYSEPVLYTVTDLDWSPDGGSLALQTDVGAYLISAGGTGLQQIEDREFYAYGSAPSWSPDSCQVVFASTQDGNPEIYILDIDVQTRQRLTDNAANDVGPVWRPILIETDSPAPS